MRAEACNASGSQKNHIRKELFCSMEMAVHSRAEEGTSPLHDNRKCRMNQEENSWEGESGWCPVAPMIKRTTPARNSFSAWGAQNGYAKIGDWQDGQVFPVK